MDDNKVIIGLLQGLTETVGEIKVRVCNIEVRVEKTESRIDNIERRMDKIEADIAIIKEDVEIIKEDASETRSGANLVIDWAERMEQFVKIPLIPEKPSYRLEEVK
ncbi:MAG: hypothetical protein FWC67_01025 [Defluviitaleaceae bacterium]|nr:hypothetical protein [Defluviitaleaceae bacterium]